jgi:hypothetical protein
MSAWRREAIEKFPELSSVVNSGSRLELVYELRKSFELALDQDDGTLGQRIIAYAIWAWRQSENDEQFVYFVEDLLKPTLLRSAQHDSFFRIVDKDQFLALRGFFLHVLGEKPTKEFEQEYRVRNNN